MKVTYSAKAQPRPTSSPGPDQETLNAILDKISKSGYESLSKAEKEILFRMSKQD